MMTMLIVAAVTLVAATTVFQCLYTAFYCRFMKRGCTTGSTEEISQQHVSVILCLRGVDPALYGCLKSLSAQSHRDWTLHLVFDDENDSAREPAENWCDEFGIKPEMHFIDHTDFELGGLKCHAIVTAFNSGIESEFIALIDADSIVDRHWLRDLLAPFENESVAATTGNRWFEPYHGPDGMISTGSMVRMIWSAAAVVQMYIYNIAWGGSLVLRRSAVERCGLIDRWRSSLCEDTMLAGVLAKSGLQLVRVPDVIALNRETTSTADAFRWIIRQLITVRLYHKGWPLVLLHGAAIGLCLLAVPVLLIISAATVQWTHFTILSAMAVLFPTINCLIIGAIGSANRSVIARRFSLEDNPQVRLPQLRFLTAIMLTQFLQPLAAIRAAVAKQVNWRGIEYGLNGGQVQMKEYRPYSQTESACDQSATGGKRHSVH